MKVKINEYISINLDLPDEMTGDEFLGVIEVAGRYVRKNLISKTETVSHDGVSKYRHFWTEEEDKTIIELTEKGFKADYIADKLGRQVQAIYFRKTKLRKEGKIGGRKR